MKKANKIAGTALAIVAAAAFATIPVVASADSAKVQCFGVNKCKGHGACKGADNSCKGKNTCKGQGVKMMSKKKCDKLGGTTK
jgi:uncharacterized membrane protein